MKLKKIVCVILILTMCCGISTFGLADFEGNAIPQNANSSIYGEYYNEEFDYFDLAELVIHANSVEVDESYNITFSEKIPLLDVNDVLVDYAINFEANDGSNNLYGYVILGAHSKTPLIKDIVFNDSISFNTTQQMYYLPDSNIYAAPSTNVNVRSENQISNTSFYQIKQNMSSYGYAIDVLDDIESENSFVIQLINQSEINDYEPFTVRSNEHFDGTDSNAYGYGGITSITTYLQDRYGGNPIKVDEDNNNVSVNAATMSAVSGKSANNCSVVAISKIMYYWRNNGKDRLPSALGTIYDEVETISVEYGYNDQDGLGHTKINNVCEDYLQDYNYNSNCNGVYIWSFNSQVKGEIDAGRPVILNITSGYYGNHSVVVNGYEIYEINGVEYPFIQVSDGWVYGYRYIDYNDFARSTLASFNTVSF